MSTAADMVARLGLRPHPEGGHYVETYRHLPEGGLTACHPADGGLTACHPADGGGRGACTAIYYLLARGERSHWHRVDAVEVWAFHAGDPLRLSIHENGATRVVVLGADIAAGQVPQAVVPPHAWQAAEPLGDWSLVGCVVAPAFEFAGFEMAPPGWTPEEEGR